MPGLFDREARLGGLGRLSSVAQAATATDDRELGLKLTDLFARGTKVRGL
jgi:hypothetical protein